jgi:nucleotide-binding universal stress UspA family protein
MSAPARSVELAQQGHETITHESVTTETMTPSEPTHRIVVGVDGSDISTAALDWAAGYAEMTGATVVALTAWEWPTTFGVAMFMPDEYDPAADARSVLDGALATVRKDHPDVRIETVIEESRAAPALVAASSHADLLVVGSRGHGELGGMLLGSVSEHCAAGAHCPVVVFRPRG